MFYSHDILSNSQYGVSTIWLVATVGKGSQSKLNRRKIQGVNVPKACEKIIDPGAPLALRLQGNLLYGVSRVFSQQCNYVLSDAEKTQSDMMTFFRSMNTSETDPKAGKAKRRQIMLEDDPQFDPMAMLPRLEEILGHETKLNPTSSQESGHEFSQMSPLDRNVVSSAATSRRFSIVGLDLPPSSASVGSYQLPGGLYNSSPFHKAFNESEAMQDFRPFADDEHDLDAMCDINLDFDANGNLVSIMDAEPELPSLRGTSPDPLHTAETTLTRVKKTRNPDPRCEHGDPLCFEEAALPDAEPFAVQPVGRQMQTDALTLATETTESQQSIPARRVPPRRKNRTMVDRELRVSREDFRAWSENYAANMEAARNRPTGTSLAKAKRNALAFMYNNGLSGIGIMEQELGIKHPLAADFAGSALKAHLLGLPADEMDNGLVAIKARRRKSPEAFGEEEGHGRSVKRRLDDDEFGRGEVQDLEDGPDLGGDSVPEIGMEAAPAMEDKHSSSIMPWSRRGSAVPSSATRAPGSAHNLLPVPSPLHGRGSIVGSIERHSDPVEEPLQGLSLVSHPSSVLSRQDLENTKLEGKTQASLAGLDISNQDFLDYVVEQVNEYGAFRSDDRGEQSWINFEQLASPAVHSRAVAAQAFLHILSLATKNVVSVEQDGIEDKEPFGALRIGFATQN